MIAAMLDREEAHMRYAMTIFGKRRFEQRYGEGSWDDVKAELEAECRAEVDGLLERAS